MSTHRLTCIHTSTLTPVKIHTHTLTYYTEAPQRTHIHTENTQSQRHSHTEKLYKHDGHDTR